MLTSNGFLHSYADDFEDDDSPFKGAGAGHRVGLNDSLDQGHKEDETMIVEKTHYAAEKEGSASHAGLEMNSLHALFPGQP